MSSHPKAQRGFKYHQRWSANGFSEARFFVCFGHDFYHNRYLFSKAGRQRKMIPQYPGSTDSVQCHPPDDVLNLGLRLSGILRPSSPIETAGSWTMGKKTFGYRGMSIEHSSLMWWQVWPIASHRYCFNGDWSKGPCKELLSKEVGKQYFRVTSDFYLMELTLMKGGTSHNIT